MGSLSQKQSKIIYFLSCFARYWYARWYLCFELLRRKELFHVPLRPAIKVNSSKETHYFLLVWIPMFMCRHDFLSYDTFRFSFFIRSERMLFVKLVGTFCQFFIALNFCQKTCTYISSSQLLLTPPRQVSCGVSLSREALLLVLLLSIQSKVDQQLAKDAPTLSSTLTPCYWNKL